MDAPLPNFAGGIESAKRWFFDSERVLKVADRARVRALSKAGAFIRRSAKSSIRQRKAVSQPGSPPSSHTGLLRDNIFFAYEPTRGGNVVIGPTALNQVFRGFGGDRVLVPEVLEYGGSYLRRVRGKQELVRIAARPYMRPALKANLEKFADLFRDSIGRVAA